MLSGVISLSVTVVVAVFIVLLISFAHTINRWVKISFAGLLFGLLMWQATILVANQATSNLLFWNHLVFLWPTLAILSFLIFITLLRSTVTGKVKAPTSRNRVLKVVAAIALLLQLFAIVSGRIFSDVTLDPISSTYTFERGIFYPVYLAGLVALLGTAVSRLIRDFVISKKYSQEKRALRTIIITVIAAASYGLITNVALPTITGGQEYVTLGHITIDILAIGFAFSIARHQFLDIKAHVFRAVVYIFTLLLAAMAYVAATSLISSYLLDISLTGEVIVILSLVTLIVAVSFQPLRVKFDHLTNRLFFRDYYSEQDVLNQLGDLLVGTVDVKEIQQQSADILTMALKPVFLRYVLMNSVPRDDIALLRQLEQSGLHIVAPHELDRSHQAALIQSLRDKDVALAVRLRTKHDDLGFMLLGFRQSGADYAFGDRKFLGLVADQLAIGLQNALRFEEIERFNATLQQKIEDATKKLRHSNEKLRLLDQTKDDFISMASHQLRTPLTSIKGYVSMVLEGDSGPINTQQRKMLNQAFISSQRMVYLISDLLNVSRLKTGKFVIEPIATNLADVIKGEVEQLVETAKGRGLTLVYNKPSHFPTLMLDETKMRQVIMNFVDNAIYYTPSGGTITINLVEKPLSIEFTVVDDGIGVPKHEQHHLFTKFYRAHNAKRARPDGTGLGLFMAKKVIVAQGGAIIFRSQEKKGSTFGFTFAKERLAATVDAGKSAAIHVN